MPLSTDLQVGDRVWLRTAGAYTTAYASTFNGFPVPTTHYRGNGQPTASEQRTSQSSELRSSGTSTANSLSASSPTMSSTFSLVAASTTGAAAPAS